MVEASRARLTSFRSSLEPSGAAPRHLELSTIFGQSGRHGGALRPSWRSLSGPGALREVSGAALALGGLF
eukprot:6845306-Pyramimonas_sp.AAC.1